MQNNLNIQRIIPRLPISWHAENNKTLQWKNPCMCGEN